MPCVKDELKIRPEWQEMLYERENALRKRHILTVERYNEHCKELNMLEPGTHVSVQNQCGSKPNRWDRTGIVVESLPNRQYLVRIDGSGRVTRRNRKFLRLINPACSDVYRTPRQLSTLSEETFPSDRVIVSVPRSVASTGNEPRNGSESQETQSAERHAEASASVTDANQPMTTEPRRSSRNRMPRQIFQANIKGKSHDSNCPSWKKGVV